VIGQDGAAWDDAGEQKAMTGSGLEDGPAMPRNVSGGPQGQRQQRYYGINITCFIGKCERIWGGRSSRLRCFAITDNIKLANAVRYPIMCLSKVMIWTWCCLTKLD
jgi:hypothetical protein